MILEKGRKNDHLGQGRQPDSPKHIPELSLSFINMSRNYNHDEESEQENKKQQQNNTNHKKRLSPSKNYPLIATKPAAEPKGKISKAIQNNIDMYFKRDSARIKTVKATNNKTTPSKTNHQNLHSHGGKPFLTMSTFRELDASSPQVNSHDISNGYDAQTTRGNKKEFGSFCRYDNSYSSKKDSSFMNYDGLVKKGLASSQAGSPSNIKSKVKVKFGNNSNKLNKNSSKELTGESCLPIENSSKNIMILNANASMPAIKYKPEARSNNPQVDFIKDITKSIRDLKKSSREVWSKKSSPKNSKMSLFEKQKSKISATERQRSTTRIIGQEKLGTSGGNFTERLCEILPYKSSISGKKEDSGVKNNPSPLLTSIQGSQTFLRLSTGNLSNFHNSNKKISNSSTGTEFPSNHKKTISPSKEFTFTGGTKQKKHGPVSKNDIDGEDSKTRDYQLNNLFKMIDYFEKDQKLTSDRLAFRVESLLLAKNTGVQERGNEPNKDERTY